LRHASGQDFVNLNFEDANLSGHGAGMVPATDAIPGWTAYTGRYAQSSIPYNFHPSAANVGVWGANALPPALDGAYSIDLHSGSESYGMDASISQTGLVPDNAASLRFIAQGAQSPFGGELLVFLGGQNILSVSSSSAGPGYTLYSANIPSALTGQTEQLAFIAPIGIDNSWEIDDIQFSPLSVPEPNILALFALGGLLFVLRR